MVAIEVSVLGAAYYGLMEVKGHPKLCPLIAPPSPP